MKDVRYDGKDEGGAWIMNVAENEIYGEESGRFYFDGKNITELADRYGIPLYVFSERELRKNVAKVMAQFRAYHANISIHYAARYESTVANLQIIRNAGGNLEVSSGGELFKGLYAGFRGGQIIFNGVDKTEEEIEMAVINNVKSINADSEFELKRIVDIAKNLKKRAGVSLRIGAGFGIAPDEAEEIVRCALENQKWICLKGYHFHVGAQTSPLIFAEDFWAMLELAVSIYKGIGYYPRLLHLEGETEEVAQEVRTELNATTLIQWAGKEVAELFRDMELVLSPGKEIAASAGVFISSRIATGRGDLVVIKNAGAYDTLNLSNCNGKLKAGALLIRKNGEVISIRHAQKYGDLILDEIKL